MKTTVNGYWQISLYDSPVLIGYTLTQNVFSLPYMTYRVNRKTSGESVHVSSPYIRV